MKDIFILAIASLGILFPAVAAAVSAEDQLPAGFRLERESSAACSPTNHISVDRFYARLVTGTPSSTIDVTVFVDGEAYGTETLSIVDPGTAGATEVELLRFHPLERLRLLDLAAAGSRVELHSERFLEDPRLPLSTAVEIREESADVLQLDSISNATITRSTWTKGQSSPDDQSGLRRIFGDQTYTECLSVCEDIERDCISYWNCHWADDQCLGHCAQEREECEEDCPCTGEDPVLVDEYTETTTHVVSGPHGSVCAGDVANGGASKVWYDVYTVFHRTNTYRVWEDCHGDQTTELVGTHDSGHRTCYGYSGAFCSSSPGMPPLCVF